MLDVTTFPRSLVFPFTSLCDAGTFSAGGNVTCTPVTSGWYQTDQGGEASSTERSRARVTVLQ